MNDRIFIEIIQFLGVLRSFDESFDRKRKRRRRRRRRRVGMSKLARRGLTHRLDSRLRGSSLGSARPSPRPLFFRSRTRAGTRAGTSLKRLPLSSSSSATQLHCTPSDKDEKRTSTSTKAMVSSPGGRSGSDSGSDSGNAAKVIEPLGLEKETKLYEVRATSRWQLSP